MHGVFGKPTFDFKLGMDRIAVLPDIRPTGCPAILKSSYRISGRIPDISDIDRVTQIIETSQIFKQE